MKGFRKFLLRGNVVDLAVGVVIGAAFTSVVKGFTGDFLTPLIGLFVGKNNDLSSQVQMVHGQHFAYGDFLNTVITFLITAAVVYFCVVLPVTKLSARFATKADVDAPKKDCPECLSSIPAAASRCAFCTASVQPEFATVPRQ
ncbi:large conductance mechanosensitive channel protein MscL [Streptacidiphilus pinicola]|uniref:Large conductance mechanosensitive channel protein MscL n=1 Tax=Streptacidiphilus pinicola TaxID=2219663 RepID=A0A2X0IEU9_9ACTN|nr:large conductance mechanosensitive channel protein MscL [Streptacidiphilus pinicola]RAG83047.1 large conductance mechanosensitive channel protein MscL [Streptacidiphilus pinicola]